MISYIHTKDGEDLVRSITILNSIGYRWYEEFAIFTPFPRKFNVANGIKLRNDGYIYIMIISDYGEYYKNSAYGDIKNLLTLSSNCGHNLNSALKAHSTIFNNVQDFLESNRNALR